MSYNLSPLGDFGVRTLTDKLNQSSIKEEAVIFMATTQRNPKIYFRILSRLLLLIILIQHRTANRLCAAQS